MLYRAASTARVAFRSTIPRSAQLIPLRSFHLTLPKLEISTQPIEPPQAKPRRYKYLSPPDTFDNAIFSRRADRLGLLKRDLGDDYATTKINTKLLLDSLKDMQAWRSWQPKAQNKAGLFKEAHRYISQISGGKKELRLAEVEEVITPEFGVVWRMIHQVIKDGQPEELAKLNDVQKAMVLFSRVHGLGAIYAKRFAEHGARTLEDLTNAADKQYGGKVLKAQLIGIKHFDDLEKLIPRDEVTRIHEEFGRILKKKVDSKFRYEVMGSYRRGAKYSSDVDIVVYHPSYEKQSEMDSKKDFLAAQLMYSLRQELLDEGFLHEDNIFSSGNRKIMALTRATKGRGTWRQVDIRLCPTESVPYMLVGNTGDMQLMKMLRGRAMEKGLGLNEYGMGRHARTSHGRRVQKIEAEVPASSERDIFKALDLPYLEPEQRSFSQYKTIPAYSRLIPRE